MSRKSFYVYFSTLDALVVRLVARIRTRADAALARYAAPDSDVIADGRAALRAVGDLYLRHGPLIRALAESSKADPAAKRAWRDFTEPVTSAVAERIRLEVEAGRVSGIDVDATVEALIGMNLSAFFEHLIDGDEDDLDRVVDTLHTVWVRVLYGGL